MNTDKKEKLNIKEVAENILACIIAFVVLFVIIRIALLISYVVLKIILALLFVTLIGFGIHWIFKEMTIRSQVMCVEDGKPAVKFELYTPKYMFNRTRLEYIYVIYDIKSYYIIKDRIIMNGRFIIKENKTTKSGTSGALSYLTSKEVDTIEFSTRAKFFEDFEAELSRQTGYQ